MQKGGYKFELLANSNKHPQQQSFSTAPLPLQCTCCYAGMQSMGEINAQSCKKNMTMFLKIITKF